MRLRPGHLIWVLETIFRNDGSDDERHHGGAGVLTSLVADLDQPVTLVIGADDVCEPCRYNHDGRCVDGLDWTPVITKQEWLERRDVAAFRLLGVSPGTTRPVGEWVGLFGDRLGTLMALSPTYEDYESTSNKGRAQQRRYSEGLRLVGERGAQG